MTRKKLLQPDWGGRKIKAEQNRLGTPQSGYGLTRQEMAGITNPVHAGRKWVSYFGRDGPYAVPRRIRNRSRLTQ